jgi:hypothetical protein
VLWALAGHLRYRLTLPAHEPLADLLHVCSILLGVWMPDFPLEVNTDLHRRQRLRAAVANPARYFQSLLIEADRFGHVS